MKKIVMLFVLLICFIDVRSQNIELISKQTKIDTVFNRSFVPISDTSQKITYKYKADNIYTSSLYFDKGGYNLMWGGILFGTSAAVGVVPLFLDNPKKEVLYVFYGVSGGLFLTSVVQFIVGGNQISRGGIILRSNKNYIIETTGSSIKVKF